MVSPIWMIINTEEFNELYWSPWEEIHPSWQLKRKKVFGLNINTDLQVNTLQQIFFSPPSDKPQVWFGILPSVWKYRHRAGKYTCNQKYPSVELNKQTNLAQVLFVSNRGEAFTCFIVIRKGGYVWEHTAVHICYVTPCSGGLDRRVGCMHVCSWRSYNWPTAAKLGLFRTLIDCYADSCMGDWNLISPWALLVRDLTGSHSCSLPIWTGEALMIENSCKVTIHINVDGYYCIFYSQNSDFF